MFERGNPYKNVDKDGHSFSKTLGEEILGGILEAALDKIFSKKNKEETSEDKGNEEEAPQPEAENDQPNAAEIVATAVISTASKYLGLGVGIFLDVTTLSGDGNYYGPVSGTIFSRSQKSSDEIHSLVDATLNAEPGETAGDIIRKWREQQKNMSPPPSAEKPKQSPPQKPSSKDKNKK